MATWDRGFIDGLFWRMLGLGTATAALLAFWIDLRFGWSLVLGTLVGAFSLRITAFAVERILRGVQEGTRRSAGWAGLLAIKLFLLFAACWISLAILKAHAVAFVLGFKMIFPALFWQTLVQKPQDGPDDGADDNESS